MPRARNIKPGFFRNEDLAEISFGDRILFIGLWTLADREGRLEDRPKRIKIEIFPCDEYDVDGGLTQLSRLGFIRRYKVGGERYIDIPNFKKHQSPHHTEKPSILPEFRVSESAPDIHASANVEIPLNPESRILNPESRTPKVDSPAAPDPDPVGDVVEKWNQFAMRNGLSVVMKVDDKRKRSVLARLKEKNFDLLAIFTKIGTSDFLRGLRGNWKGADFDFVFCSAHNYVKILEGKYDNATNNGAGNRANGGSRRETFTEDTIQRLVKHPAPIAGRNEAGEVVPADSRG